MTFVKTSSLELKDQKSHKGCLEDPNNDWHVPKMSHPSIDMALAYNSII
jgi:hypothetical protein